MQTTGNSFTRGALSWDREGLADRWDTSAMPYQGKELQVARYGPCDGFVAREDRGGADDN